jgi:hypothetical protein
MFPAIIMFTLTGVSATFNLFESEIKF